MPTQENRMMQERPAQLVPHWVLVGTGIAIIVIAFALAFPATVAMLMGR